MANTPAMINEGCIVWKAKNDNNENLIRLGKLYLSSIGK
jgi:hypothetical protein